MNKPLEDLRVDVLSNIADHYGLEYKKNNKEDIIKQIKLYESDKIFYDTTYRQLKDGWWDIGVDIKNQQLLVTIGKMVEKKEAMSIGRYYDHRVHYKIKNKPS